MFGLSWRCEKCGHGNVDGDKRKLKRELKEELEFGIEKTCIYCKEETELDESNATIIKIED